MAHDISYNGNKQISTHFHATYTISSDVANTYMLSGDPGGGITSSYASQTYVTSSTGITHVTSSYVALTYATSSQLDAFPTSGEIADTYATSSLAETHAVSSDVADTYATSSLAETHAVSSDVAGGYVASSQLATRINGGSVLFYSDSGEVYNSAEVAHLLGGAPGSVVLTYGVPLGSGVETLWASDLTDSSFWVNIGTPHETSSTVYWIAYRGG